MKTEVLFYSAANELPEPTALELEVEKSITEALQKREQLFARHRGCRTIARCIQNKFKGNYQKFKTAMGREE